MQIRRTHVNRVYQYLLQEFNDWGVVNISAASGIGGGGKIFSGEIDFKIVADQFIKILLCTLRQFFDQSQQYRVLDNDRFNCQFRLELDLVQRLSIRWIRNRN